MVTGSKTGYLVPSVSVLKQLSEKYGKRVVPVVDACQGRVAGGALQQFMENGFAVLMTGSKFYGGSLCQMSLWDLVLGLISGSWKRFLFCGNYDRKTKCPMGNNEKVRPSRVRCCCPDHELVKSVVIFRQKNHNSYGAIMFRSGLV